jgi:hypothetical protein
MSAAARLAEARQLQRAGEPRAAIDAYRQALAAGAAEAEVHLQLGALHSDLGEHQLAVDHLSRVLSLAPRHADALCMLGTVMSDLGRYDEAARLCESAIEARPEAPEAHFNLGLALFELGDLARAQHAFARCRELRRGPAWQAGARPPALPALAEEECGVSWVKIKHDCEQLEYLLNEGRLPEGFAGVRDEYLRLLAELQDAGDRIALRRLDEARYPQVAATYKRPLHVRDDDVRGPIVNPDLDWTEVQGRYLRSDPSVMWVDGLLTPDGLATLRRFCLESSIWNDLKPGYLGAYMFDGFASPALLRLAAELRARMPQVIRGLPLQMMWGYKYESALPGAGIRLHADAAAVNVNLWITADEANLDPSTGGLLVHAHDAPADWGFAKLNLDVAAMERELAKVGTPPLRVPYRANRAVIFDSDLFHATDAPRFRDGYANRRVNITLLYGLRSS